MEIDEKALEAAARDCGAEDVGWNGTGPHPWDGWDESIRSDYRDTARAAITAYLSHLAPPTTPREGE